MSGRRGRAWRWMVRALSGRRLLAYVFLGQGVAYLGLYAGEPRRTTTYLLQGQLAPLWLYGLLLLVVGAGLLHTQQHRRTWYGRGVAWVGLGMMALLGATYWVIGAWTALGWIAPILWGLLGETAFIDEDVSE